MVVAPTAVRMMQPRLAYPAICGRPDCAHLQCNTVRQQAALPCDHCGDVIQPGEYLYVLDRATGVVRRQVHAKCAGDDL